MKHEKKLLALSVQSCGDLAARPSEKVDQYKTIRYIRYHAAVEAVDGDNVLVLTVYRANGSPEYRHFLCGNRCATQVFEKEAYCYAKEREPGKLYGAGLDSLYPGLRYEWWNDHPLVFHSHQEDAEAILRFLGTKGEPEEAVRLLAKHEAGLRQKARNAKYEAQRAKIRERFEGITDPPLALKTWCEDRVFQERRYFFYDYTGKQVQSGVCSYCLKRSGLPGIRERREGTCPGCGSRVSFYSVKRLARSRGIVHRENVALFEMHGDKVCIRYFNAGISLRGGPIGKIEKDIFLSETGRDFLSLTTGAFLERYTRWIGTRIVTVDGFAKEHYSFGSTPQRIAPFNLTEIRKKMGIWTPLEALAERRLEASPSELLDRARRKPEAEYLVKLGLYRLAEHLLSGRDVRENLLIKDRRGVDALGVPREMLPLLCEADPSARSFLAIRGLLRCGVHMKAEEIREISQLDIGWGKALQLQQMLQYLSLHKALRYIDRQCGQTDDAEHVLQRWYDYMGMAEKLGMNMDDMSVRFPKNLQAAHEEAAKLQRMKKNRELNIKVSKTAKRLRDLCWTYGGLTIRPAESHEEMFREGQELSHCVGRIHYAENMAKGKTAIFFIRHAKKPEESYVTLELDLERWVKIQCYGLRDSYPGKSVEQFVEKWLSEVVRPARCGAEKKQRKGKGAA